MAHNFFNPNVATDIKARDVAQIPYKEGQFLMTSDTNSIYYDFAEGRKRLTDIIELDTEAQRQAILVPISKFYFVKDTGKLWRYNNGDWLDMTKGGGGGTRSVHITLTVAGWGSNVQYVVPVEGLTADQNGVVGLSQDISQAEREAAASADMYVSDQADGSFTITRGGDKPTRDIPITLILFE